jgi:DNA-binding GntR family transcriptional regulator
VLIHFVESALTGESNDASIDSDMTSNNRKQLQPIKNGPIRTQVINTVREAIFSGKFRPGDDLRELHLASDLQVSQATVREALLQLEHTGLVVRKPNKGTSVTKFSTEEMCERVSIRVPLESMAAVMASRQMTREDFAELERRSKRISEAVTRGAVLEQSEADLNFHRFIWQCSGNETLYRMLDQLNAPLFAFTSIQRLSYLKGTWDKKLQDTVPDHEPIVEALRSCDLQRIMESIHSHLLTSYPPFLDAALEGFQVLAFALKSNRTPPAPLTSEMSRDPGQDGPKASVV